ncbi:hypothetical protein B0T20DRAFT_420499 [Sordaria brevicollis]|uniref:Uncharacterized protein n=1 Tax=Sordaria brevicollis TaxID=83679 RepID=A0AAE0U5Z8_SORBR|nr:hypothetical protein B0T20DRAFT_420499 [Sordaria brevicollis]
MPSLTNINLLLSLTFLAPSLILAAPNPNPNPIPIPSTDPSPDNSGAFTDIFANNPNVALSPSEALAAYHGPLNRREGGGAEYTPNWTGGNKEVIHFFNCEKRPNWGFGVDSVVAIYETPTLAHDTTYRPPDDALCVMRRSLQKGDFHIWEGEPQACHFIAYNNTLSWKIEEGAQGRGIIVSLVYTPNSYLTSDTHVYEGFKDSKPRGLDVPFMDCNSIYYFKLTNRQVVHG